MMSSQDTRPSTAATKATAMTTSQSEPVYQRMEQEQHPTPTDRCAWVVPSIVAALLPCLPIAQVVSRGHHRVGFAVVFVSVFVLYVGGIACFFASSLVYDPVIVVGRPRVVEVSVLAVGWVTYVLGPFTTIALDLFVWFCWQLHYGLTEDPEDTYTVSTFAIALLALHFICQLLLTIAAVVLTLKLRGPLLRLRS